MQTDAIRLQRDRLSVALVEAEKKVQAAFLRSTGGALKAVLQVEALQNRQASLSLSVARLHQKASDGGY